MLVSVKNIVSTRAYRALKRWRRLARCLAVLSRSLRARGFKYPRLSMRSDQGSRRSYAIAIKGGDAIPRDFYID
jgi:hypothetical protein